MIRIYVQPNPSTGKLTVTMKDGGNSRILMSSTSQGYDRQTRAVELARRIAPRGEEVVELVIRDRGGKDVHREFLWSEDDIAAAAKGGLL